MDHIAYMKPSWGLLPKIISGEKQIESRWYINKHLPWGKIKKGDLIYFKNSGEPITISAEVNSVLSFEKLNPQKVHQILAKYHQLDGIHPSMFNYFYNLFKNKRYCLLIFVKNPQKITPFNINKTGFGAMSAWITLENIDKIRTSITRR